MNVLLTISHWKTHNCNPLESADKLEWILYPVQFYFGAWLNIFRFEEVSRFQSNGTFPPRNGNYAELLWRPHRRSLICGGTCDNDVNTFSSFLPCDFTQQQQQQLGHFSPADVFFPQTRKWTEKHRETVSDHQSLRTCRRRNHSTPFHVK